MAVNGVRVAKGVSVWGCWSDAQLRIWSALCFSTLCVFFWKTISIGEWPGTIAIATNCGENMHPSSRRCKEYSFYIETDCQGIVEGTFFQPADWVTKSTVWEGSERNRFNRRFGGAWAFALAFAFGFGEGTRKNALLLLMQNHCKVQATKVFFFLLRWAQQSTFFCQNHQLPSLPLRLDYFGPLNQI